MYKTRVSLFLPVLLFFLALGSASAVAGQPGPGHGPMMGQHQRMPHTKPMYGPPGRMWGMDMFAYVPMAILFQKDLLGLSDEQVQKIRSIKQEMRKAGSDHEAFEKLHEQMASAFKEGHLDLSAYQAALRNAADYLVKTRMETAREAQDALQVLNQDQRSHFLYSMQVMHEWVEMHGMRRHMMHRWESEKTEGQED